MTDFEYRGIGIRLAAIVIDTVVLFVLAFLIAIPTGGTTGAGFTLQGGPAILWFLISFAYYIVLEAQYGQTAGKRAVGIEVVTENGDPLDYRGSVIRNVLRIIDGFLIYLVGAVVIFFSDKEQRLGDHIANTVVVSVQR